VARLGLSQLEPNDVGYFEFDPDLLDAGERVIGRSVVTVARITCGETSG
jgi:hypothetical protein